MSSLRWNHFSGSTVDVATPFVGGSGYRFLGVALALARASDLEDFGARTKVLATLKIRSAPGNTCQGGSQLIVKDHASLVASWVCGSPRLGWVSEHPALVGVFRGLALVQFPKGEPFVVRDGVCPMLRSKAADPSDRSFAYSRARVAGESKLRGDQGWVSGARAFHSGSPIRDFPGGFLRIGPSSGWEPTAACRDRYLVAVRCGVGDGAIPPEGAGMDRSRHGPSHRAGTRNGVGGAKAVGPPERPAPIPPGEEVGHGPVAVALAGSL